METAAVVSYKQEAFPVAKTTVQSKK